jgi:hypothetical protein
LNGQAPITDPAVARAHAREFSWDRTADQMLSAFREVL